MNLPRPLSRTLRATAVAATFLVAVTVASAHAHPRTITPAPDSVGPAPAQVSIVFTEALEPKLSSISVATSDGSDVTKTVAAVDSANPAHLSLPLPKLIAGVYSVHWVAVATDGHRTEGTFHFTVQ